MANIGVSELIVILLILLLVFGASRLPALGESLGKTIRSFKRGMGHDETIEVSEAGPKRVAAGRETLGDEISDAEIREEKKRKTTP